MWNKLRQVLLPKESMLCQVLGLFAMLLLLCFTGCAKLFRPHYADESGSGINVILRAEDKDARIQINGKAIIGTLIYDGEKKASSYYVYHFPLTEKFSTVNITVQKGSVSKIFSVERKAASGSWSNTPFVFVDKLTGSLYSYDDIVVP